MAPRGDVFGPVEQHDDPGITPLRPPAVQVGPRGAVRDHEVPAPGPGLAGGGARVGYRQADPHPVDPAAPLPVGGASGSEGQGQPHAAGPAARRRAGPWPPRASRRAHRPGRGPHARRLHQASSGSAPCAASTVASAGSGPHGRRRAGRGSLGARGSSVPSASTASTGVRSATAIASVAIAGVSHAQTGPGWRLGTGPGQAHRDEHVVADPDSSAPYRAGHGRACAVGPPPDPRRTTQHAVALGRGRRGQPQSGAISPADLQAPTRVRPGPGVRPVHHHHLPASARHAPRAGGVGRCPVRPGGIAHRDPAALHPWLDPGHLVLAEPVTADAQRGLPQRARADQVHQARPARRQLDPGRDLHVTARVEGEPHGGQDRSSRTAPAGPTDRSVDGPRYGGLWTGDGPATRQPGGRPVTRAHSVASAVTGGVRAAERAGSTEASRPAASATTSTMPRSPHGTTSETLPCWDSRIAAPIQP